MRHGFTLIELMIVIAIIAIIAAIAIPNLLESRISSNEAASAATLKSGVHPAQVQFQSGNYVDVNANGIGDFADDLSFMAGYTTAVTTDGAPNIVLSLLPSMWNQNDDAGTTSPAVGYIALNGYAFRTAANNEIAFGAFAGPIDRGNSIGRRCFAINASGTAYATVPAALNPGRAEAGAAPCPFGNTGYTSYNTGWSVYRR